MDQEITSRIIYWYRIFSPPPPKTLFKENRVCTIRIRNTGLYRVSDVGSVTNAFAASAAVVATVPVSALTAATLSLQYQPKQ